MRQTGDLGEIMPYAPVFQSGYGVRRMHLNVRPRLGYGIGSTLFSFFRPFLKRGFHELLGIASKVAVDASKGKNMKDSAIKHSLNRASDLLGSVMIDRNKNIVAAEKWQKDLGKTSGKGKSRVSWRRDTEGVKPKKRKRSLKRKPKIQTKKKGKKKNRKRKLIPHPAHLSQPPPKKRKRKLKIKKYSALNLI